MSNTVYTAGEFVIAKGEFGYQHGLCWALWRGHEVVDTGDTLRGMKRTAAALGCSGGWIRQRIEVLEIGESQ